METTTQASGSRTRILLLTALAMLAFAANSLLCRQALGNDAIDAASFTAVRVLSGAVVLALLLLPRWRRQGRTRTDWAGASLLFAYMLFFSFAYVTLNAGTGALLLFAAVQLTMFAAALRRGERFPPLAWLGLALAFGGLVYLVAPGLTAPEPRGALLMTIAGAAWGGYSLRGSGAHDPLEATANNFIAALPLALLVSLLFLGQARLTTPGLVLALASGAVASGLGYAVWYAALRRLAASSAATVQLSVPVIAAAGGVLLLAEPVTVRLALSATATLGGIALVLVRRRASPRGTASAD